MKHTKTNCTAGNLFISSCGLQCGNCLACECGKCMTESKETKYNLIEDRTWNKEEKKTVFTGTENECFEWVHKNHSFSFSEALKNQGFSLINISN